MMVALGAGGRRDPYGNEAHMTGKWISALTGLLAAALLTGCQTPPTYAPMPDVALGAGVLLKTSVTKLGANYELREYELYRSDWSNDFYPFNVHGATIEGHLLSKLFVWAGGKWQFLDFVHLENVVANHADNVSPDGWRIVYERPAVLQNEGEYPRAFENDRRSRQVVIYDHRTRKNFVLENFSEAYGLGQGSFWTPDGSRLAMTTSFIPTEPQQRGLVVMDFCGNILLDAGQIPEMEGLEFIGWSPDLNKVAALRPLQAGVSGCKGGALIEVDVANHKARAVGEIPPPLVCKFNGRFEQLVKWDDKGNLSVDQ
jgi:hypothetical protein